MKRKRYTDEQIAFALRHADSGTAVEEICRKLGVSEATFYRWKKQFAGMGTAEIRRSSTRPGRGVGLWSSPSAASRSSVARRNRGGENRTGLPSLVPAALRPPQRRSPTRCSTSSRRCGRVRCS